MLRVKECKHKCNFYQEHEQHRLATERDNKEAIAKIAAIIQKEKQQSFRWQLNYIMGRKRIRSTTSVQVEEPTGLVSERSTHKTVEDAIFSEVHEKQYMLAEEAPVGGGKLFEDFGYVANTPASKTVFDRTYQPPPDSDVATKELFAENAAIRKMISKGSNSSVITLGKSKQY
jgi:hypothetical protein